MVAFMPTIFFRIYRKVPWATVAVLFVATALSSRGQSNEVIYADALQNGWQNYGWATLNYSCTSPVHSGSDSISVTIAGGYQAIYIAHAAFDSTPFTNLTFWVNGGATGGQSQMYLQGLLNGNAQTGVLLPTFPANSWLQVTVSLSALGVADQSTFSGFWIQDESGNPQATFYLDDISLIAGSGIVTPTTNPPVFITVDALKNRRAISPLIYGMAFAASNQLSDLNCPINRSGGNSETRYNWEINAHNLAHDWYFESYPDASATAGATADSFVADGRPAGAASMITIPMIGWAPILGSGRAIIPSYSVAKYGPQTHSDPYLANAGNGISVTNGTLITWNNPTDANVAVDSTFQQGYVSHLTNKWGTSAQGGVGYYLLDNEHSIWFSTHQDVHPIGPTMQEIGTKMLTYAAMIKSTDSNALVLGPEEWGWSGYFYSGYDQQWSGAHNNYNPAQYPDRGTNGGMDYIPWLLTQMRQYDTNTGQRLLDYLTVHCYPQSGEYGNDVSTSMELLRNKSTRQLWDSNYVDASWIGSIVELIPRMHSWVSNYYPGTKIGITEYNWGADAAINFATAQADILGIFGREGLDLATRWTAPTNDTPVYEAFKMYRNYDGEKSTFGDTSVSASGPDPDDVSVFGATRSSDGALTVMVVNKQLTGVTPATIAFTNYLAGSTAQRWQLTSSSVISRLSDVPLTGTSLSNNLPAQSITLFILPPGGRPTLRAVGVNAGNTFSFWLSGQPGQGYAILASSNLVSWQTIQTNTLAGTNSVLVSVPTANAARFYRAEWVQ